MGWQDLWLIACCSAPGKWSCQDCVEGIYQVLSSLSSSWTVRWWGACSSRDFSSCPEPCGLPAVQDALHSLVLVARGFLRCGDCCVPAAPLPTRAALACMPCPSSRGFPALQGQHASPCCLPAAWPPSHGLACPRKALLHCRMAGEAAGVMQRPPGELLIFQKRASLFPSAED